MQILENINMLLIFVLLFVCGVFCQLRFSALVFRFRYFFFVLLIS